MERNAGVDEQLAVAIEVEAVVTAAAVERAATRPQQARFPQMSQGVGAGGLALLERPEQPAHPATPPRQLTQKPPPQRMTRQLEQRRNTHHEKNTSNGIYEFSRSRGSRRGISASFGLGPVRGSGLV